MADQLHNERDEGRREGVAPSMNSRRWWLSRWIVWGGVGVFLLALAVGGWVTSLDRTCSSCHVLQASRSRASAHATVSCYGCHLDGRAWGFLDAKAAELFRMYPAAVGGVKLTGPGRRVPRVTCVRCHEVPPPDVLESKGLRIRHDACAAPPAMCDSCHNGVAHGDAVRWIREPVMDDCLGCHKTFDAPNECDACHAGKLQSTRLTSGPWQVTHGPNWQDAHGMGDLDTCASCHEPAKCISCHKTEIPHPENFLNTHGKQALRPDATCTRCHQTKGWCTSCHGVEMPHPTGFLKNHSRVAKNRTDPKCLNCHIPKDCIICHEKHVHPGLITDSMGATLTPEGDR